MRGRALFEGVSAIIFVGVLAQQLALHSVATGALTELSARGYSIPTVESPVTVRPVEKSGSHAGRWRPGMIELVSEPKSDFSSAVYIRHELMHEANNRTCGGSLPPWVNEAAAIAFSGEANTQEGMPPTVEEVESFAKAARLRVPLSPAHMKTVAALVAEHGWPREPCARSKEIEKIVANGSSGIGASAVSYVLMHAVSGRVFESSGKIDQREPLGSVMKIPYVASLGDMAARAAGALVPSDTDALRGWAVQLDRSQYRRLVDVSGAEWSGESPVDTLLGERDRIGRFPLVFSLIEAARLVRASLFVQPSAFSELVQQVDRSDATLARSSREFKSVLRQLSAGAKTGTVSDENGEPLMGHLVVFWPASRPTMIAVFRKPGVRGAGIADAALPFLREWSKRYRYASRIVRVRLLSALPRQAWTLAPLDAKCGTLSTHVNNQEVEMTGCGVWRITTPVKRARDERLVTGVIRAGVLETDLESYVDSVASAEGDGLRAAALQALRAVITANAMRGELHRHAEASKQALCDTTHCMVFLGARENALSRGQPRTDAKVVDHLVRSPGASGRSWYPFSVGGDEAWSKRISAEALAGFAHEQVVLDLRRERTREGQVRLRLFYPAGEEVVPCDMLMLKFDLPTCPDEVRAVAGAFEVSGRGRGHGEGLSLIRANYLAGQGATAAQILDDAFS